VLCAGAAILIVVILTSGSDDDSARAFGTAIAIAFLSLTAAAGVNLIDRKPEVAMIGYLAILASLVALLAIVNLIWGDSILSDSSGAKAAAYSLTVAIALGNTSWLLAGHDDDDPDRIKLVRGATVAMLWALAISLVAGIEGDGDNVSASQLGVTAVLYGLGALALPLLRLTES